MKCLDETNRSLSIQKRSSIDLAARNILLTALGTPKISDFGFSRSVEDGEGTTKSNLGPLKYMSPEAIANNSYSTQSDVWSFGIVVWEILVTLSKSSSHLFQTRQTPHTDLDIIEAAHQIKTKGLHPPIPSEAPEHIQQLLKDCWQLFPSQRPSFKLICERIRFWNLKVMIKSESVKSTVDPIVP